MRATFWRLYLFACAALLYLLLGCSALQPESVESSTAESNISVYGTLSDANNPADRAASVVYTRLAGYRFRAASMLRKDKISVNSAVIAQQRADEIRAALDVALKKRDLVVIDSLSRELDGYSSVLEAIQ